MRTFSALRMLLVAGALGASAPALAFDPTVDAPTPAAAFQIGYAAYQAGDLATAVAAIGYAAAQGYARAEWLLGQMYAKGEGVDRDDHMAFEIFAGLAAGHANDNPRGADAVFIADAYVALGDYYRKGGTAVAVADGERARLLYLHAATYFADADAQFNLAAMFYAGEIGVADPVQAVRWARLAAENGSPAAQGLLGYLLFEGEGVTRQPVLGLAYLTIAIMRSPGAAPDLQRMHEHAFSVATEVERRTAFALAENWLAANNVVAQRTEP